MGTLQLSSSPSHLRAPVTTPLKTRPPSEHACAKWKHRVSRVLGDTQKTSWRAPHADGSPGWDTEPWGECSASRAACGPLCPERGAVRSLWEGGSGCGTALLPSRRLHPPAHPGSAARQATHTAAWTRHLPPGPDGQVLSSYTALPLARLHPFVCLHLCNF